VNPDAGLVIDRRAGQQHEFIARVNAVQLSTPFTEHGPVDGGAESASRLRRQRRWYSGVHMG
jgi:hypothetical protein